MKRISVILNRIVFAISSINSFAFMGILNAIISIVFLFTGDRVGAVAFGIFGFIWGIIALVVALKNQFWSRYKAAANSESPKL